MKNRILIYVAIACVLDSCPSQTVAGPIGSKLQSSFDTLTHGFDGRVVSGVPLGDLHHTSAESSDVQLRRLSGEDIQAFPRWKGSGRVRKIRQAARGVRVDPRDSMSI